MQIVLCGEPAVPSTTLGLSKRCLISFSQHPAGREHQIISWMRSQAQRGHSDCPRSPSLLTEVGRPDLCALGLCLSLVPLGAKIMSSPPCSSPLGAKVMGVVSTVWFQITSSNPDSASLQFTRQRSLETWMQGACEGSPSPKSRDAQETTRTFIKKQFLQLAGGDESHDVFPFLLLRI